MRKLHIYFLTLLIFLTNFNTASAASKKEKKKSQVLTYKLKTDSFEESPEQEIDEEKIYFLFLITVISL